MIRLILIIVFNISMIFFTLFIMKLGYEKDNPELLLLGLGLPMWIFLIFFYSKLICWVEVGKESFKIKYLFFRNRIIYYKCVDQWEVIQSIRISQQNILLKVNGKKIIVSNITDTANYEILKDRLRINWSALEKKYN